MSKEAKIDMMLPSEQKQYRLKTNLYMAIFIIIFVMIFPSYYKINDYYLPDSIENDFDIDNSNSNNKNYGINTSGHYKILLLITSQMEEYQHRKLLRSVLFGINDNIDPCMKYDTNIYYKFLIPPYNVSKQMYKSFVSESVEYNDIVEFQHLPDLNLNFTQEIVLNWTQSLKNSGISFDFAVLLDNNSIINLSKLKRIISTFNISPIQLQYLIWGRFDDSFAEDIFVILGNKAIQTILANKDLIKKSDNQNIIKHAYLYTKDRHTSLSDNWNKLHFINDDKRFITLPERFDLIPKKTIMVRKLSSEEELIKVSIHLLIPPISVCRSHIPLYGEPSIAIVTSSYSYDNINNCSPSMLDVAYMLSENKRAYAQKHGYAFIPRSLEFQLQNDSNLNLWGKIDAVKKVLPYYDWVLWIDNDAIITNQEISIMELFTRFYQLLKDKIDTKNSVNEKIIENEKMVHHKKLDKREFSLDDNERYYDEGGPLDYAEDDDVNYDHESLFDDFDFSDEDEEYYDYFNEDDSDDDVYDFIEDEDEGIGESEDEGFAKLKRSEDGVKLLDERIHFIVSRPKKDTITNTGAFLIKNSEWSFEFLKKVQEINNLQDDKKTEQTSMWKLIDQYLSLRDRILLLDNDDHTFETFPDVWQNDDFILHFASNDCSAKFILDYFKKKN
ncbi:14122_t:CDS:2 [Cetraspora pellucida]|uniref:14122_t:CDS:1 n=1 Tax=Cetraspora pellucida TaxID=1433469 RepID=A0A9N9D1A1_9GLOM|nr:14122_t:CDS:2 [Cetraspora pellucida]